MTSNQNDDGGNNDGGNNELGRSIWDGREETWPPEEIGTWGRQIDAERAEAEEVRNTVSELLRVRANLGGEAFVYYLS